MATVKALVVGGGRSGGTGAGSGGGGAGQVTYNAALTILEQTYTITVGVAGASSIFNGITAIAGNTGSNGPTATGGTSGNAFAGGVGNGSGAGGGGGGSSAVGTAGGAGGDGGAGGAGTSNSITGSAVLYGGGGGGAGFAGGAGGGATAGGGAGGNNLIAGTNATANTGGGGGGGVTAGTGASGVVIVSYPTGGTFFALGGTMTQSGGENIHTFTSSGNLQFIFNITVPVTTLSFASTVGTFTATTNTKWANQVKNTSTWTNQTEN